MLLADFLRVAGAGAAGRIVLVAARHAWNPPATLRDGECESVSHIQKSERGRSMKVVSWAAVAGLGLSFASGCFGNLRQVRLDGSDEVFQAYGRSTLNASRAKCFAACRKVLKGSGHGVEREDEGAGTLISGRATVLRFVEKSQGSNVGLERVIDNQFYVKVTGDSTSCEVAVTRLRAWTGTEERETETRAWTGAHLQIFNKNVAMELQANP